MKIAIALVVVLCLASCAFASRQNLRKMTEKGAIPSLPTPANHKRAANADTLCYIYSCATLGQSCALGMTSNNITTAPICVSGNSTCNDTNICARTRCQCSSSAYCGSATSYQCYPGDLPNNAACSFNGQCNSNNCGSGSTCVGAAVGQSCTSDSNCNVNSDYLYCNSGTCAAQIALGGACNPQNDNCAFLYVCGATNTNGTVGTCILPFTKASGSICADQTECADGLTCLSFAGNATGVCGAAAAASGTACKSDTDCTRNYEECGCNYATGATTCMNKFSNNPTGAASSVANFNTCANQKCTITSLLDSCLISNCLSTGCAYSNLELAYQESLYSLYPTCFINYIKNEFSGSNPCANVGTTTSKSSTSGAATVYASVAVVAVAAFAMMF